ncbi:Solute carrier [Fasciola hepatica]|uniref:Solute carrier n=1 Tax=Fasciola hepatica TaxID=6192 RepID=A0A4E0RXA5_FASHE|nr:Solute carrier [Fasciola hepatica]
MLIIVKTIMLTVLFYCFSISLTFFNNRCIKIFPYPLSITFMHLCSKFILAWISRSLLIWYSGTKRTEMPWPRYVRMVALAGTSSALDIGFSNWSFEFITVSLYTMTKSTSIIFILLFSLVFRLERQRISLVFVVILIASGLFMFSYEAAQFNLVGFCLVLFASFLSGIRWTTAQLLSQKKEWGLSHPIDMIYHTQPWMALAILPLSLYIESTELVTSKTLFRSTDVGQLLGDILYLSVGGLLAFGLECSEYLVVATASGLTLSVAGIFKEVCTLYLAAKFNGDQISPINMLGFIVCISGILLHLFVKTMDYEIQSQKIAAD